MRRYRWLALVFTRSGVVRGTEFMYVGIAGRNLDLAAEHKRMRGVRDRFDSHGSGRRSGNQFAVYVCDRLVLPTLSREQIQQIAAGELSLDALTRVSIHENLAYRFAATRGYKDALGIETAFARGETEFGFPRLNPPARQDPIDSHSRRYLEVDADLPIKGLQLACSTSSLEERLLNVGTVCEMCAERIRICRYPEAVLRVFVTFSLRNWL